MLAVLGVVDVVVGACLGGAREAERIVVAVVASGIV